MGLAFLRCVADGRLFTMGHDGQKRGGKETVYCLNAKTGKPMWTDSYEAHLSIIYMRVAHVHPQSMSAVYAVQAWSPPCLSGKYRPKSMVKDMMTVSGCENAVGLCRFPLCYG